MTILLAYLTLCVVWGTTYLALKVGLEGFDPFFMAGVRFLLAGLLLLPVLFRKSARRPAARREWLAIAALGVLMLVGANGLVTYSEVYLASGLTALTVSTNPAWAALIGGWLFAKDERFGWQGIVGMALAMLGVGVLHHDRWSFSSAELPGVIAACIAPVLWATGSLIARHHVRETDPLSTSTLQMLIATPFFFPISWAAGESWRMDLTMRVVVAMVFLIVIGSAVVYAVYVWLAQRMPVSRVLTYTYVNPIVALALGYAVLHEEIHPEVYGATLLILGGLALIYFSKKKR